MKKILRNLKKIIPFQNPVARKKILAQEPLYLKDSPVTSRKEDKFQYGQMADIIYELLEEGQLPLHIGLMGSWGTGKTSVLRLLETKVNAGRKNNRKYLLKFINVWKFADDAPSLHRKIVREVESELNIKKNEGITHETTTLDMRKTTGIWSLLQRELWKRHGFIVILYVIALIVITVLYEWLFNFKDAWALSFMSSTSLLIIMIASTIINKNGIELTYQMTQKELALQHGDQFEHRFESAVSEYLKANKGKKLILVFDDLDRLPPKQLVAALNTIKTFLRSNQCAFIVPCDEEILLEGISSAFTEKKMSNFSVSEYLNKTFDLQLHLPHVEKVNMRTYAKTLLTEQKVKWTLDENISVERLLGILIHSGVRTPRQVKKILNAYAFDWYLALKRDAEAGVEFLSKQPNHIAIFTVLKTDFPNYFHIISQNPFIIQKPVEEQIKNINKEKDPLPEEDPDEFIQYLEAFLSRVNGHMPTDPRPFIYFNNQLLNPLTGRPELETTKEYILNGQNEKFSEEFFVLSPEDREVVISSTLEDIDTTNNIFANNTLKVLIQNNDALNHTKEMDLNRWEKIIVENIDAVSEFEIFEVCRGLENIGCNNFVWEVYGKKIDIEDNHQELFELWVENPKFLENLAIPDIGEKIISTLKNIGKSHIATNELTNINSDNSILKNENFDWIGNLINSMSSDNLPNGLLSTWLPTWAQKTGGDLTSDLTNGLLDEFNFKHESFLKGIGDLWCALYESSNSKQADMNTLLDLMNTNDFTGFTEDNFKQLVMFFEELDYKSISDRVHKIFSTWWEEDEDKTFDLMNYWRSAPGVVGFSSKIFSFELGEEVLKLTTEILTNRAIYIKGKLDEIISVIKDELNSAKNNNRKTIATKIIDTLITNSMWAEQMQPLTTEIFPLNNKLIWLYWPQVVVQDQAELLVSFININKALADWVVDSIFELLKVKRGQTPMNTIYSNHHTTYINILIKQLANNENIDWEGFLERALDEQLLDNLDSATVDILIITLGKKLELYNNNYHEFLVSNHTLESEYHQDIAIERWDFLDVSERKRYLEKYDSSEELKDEFGEKLVESFRLKPNIKYISELSAWKFSNTISQKIVQTIIQSVDAPKLNTWFQESLVKIIKGIDRWTMTALFTAVHSRKDLKIPKKETLDELLLLQDERSLLSLDIVKKDKTVATALRKSIMALKEAYPEQVEEVKKSFRWRKG
ncbi:P-loop NTPase fold protein [Paenibacillus polymyxa]|uniref:P-loop NTPase fold protein n=1 Tax=Paenibacillus polymyxa TaxID=1406 RepID=UPI0008460CB1|nr:P-loop NTPase fold protein [Paenibacillus polymyxa]AOK89570.1 hypothetical protein AOU00_06945 [Paenibacillus polymyxa]